MLDISTDIADLKKKAEARRKKEFSEFVYRSISILLLIGSSTVLIKIFDSKNETIMTVITVFFSIFVIGSVINAVLILIKNWEEYLNDSERSIL